MTSHPAPLRWASTLSRSIHEPASSPATLKRWRVPSLADSSNPATLSAPSHLATSEANSDVSCKASDPGRVIATSC
eukprot:Skav201328  [mRNA]  locus=scaffold1389:13191:14405:- [translate_table: standard]